MIGSAEGWNYSRIPDAVRDRGRSAYFDVHWRKRRRVPSGGPHAGASNGPTAGTQTPSPGTESGDSSGVSPLSVPSDASKSPGQPGEDGHGHKALWGAPGSDRVTALGPSSPASSGSSPIAPAFGDLASVKSMGTGRAGIIVGFDSEFTPTGDERFLDSWQFAVPDQVDPSMRVEIWIIPVEPGDRISLQTALWVVVYVAELWRSPLVPPQVGPRGVHRDEFWSDDWKERHEALAALRIPIVLVCHYGPADLTTFASPRGGQRIDLMTRLTSAGGGLVTLFAIRLQRGNTNGRWWESLSLTVRDTIAQAPAGKKSLAALGDVCGYPKLELPAGAIENMSRFRDEHFEEFLEYGMNDAVIALEYTASQWGDGVVPPITLSGGAASAMVDAGGAYLGAENSKEFRLMFAGLVNEDDGVEAADDEEGLSFHAVRNRAPVDGAAEQFTHAAASAYHGGLNQCPAPGYYAFPTEDIDAQNAYPTAMALVRDLDWEPGVIDEVVHERWLTAASVPSPTTPFIGFVSFRFPDSVQFPCLPVRADGTLVYPRSTDGVAGAWVCAPELWLALQLDAEVFCQIGYLARERPGPDHGRSLCLRAGVKQLIDDRNTAKAVFGKGSLEELLLKTAVNSVYGKTAQDVAEQKGWNAKEQEMTNVGGSAITSPYHASFTTSIVRAQLLAAANQITSTGGNVYSITTDGFITDMTAADVEALDLYGLAEVLRESREALTSDPSVWEAKHRQDDLVNFTTRGNVSLSPDGVCAHNGLKVPEGIEEDSYEDREWLLRTVVTRDGPVPNSYKRFPSFRELSRKEDRKDFIPTVVEREVSLDYDLKRRPMRSSMTAKHVPLPDGSAWEMATFTTEPWDSVEECLRARRIAREMRNNGCLRTVAQWRDWDVRFSHGKGRRIVTPQRALLMSIVMAHRQGVVSIPTLADRSLSVPARLEWLAEWGLGTVSRGDWDNARRPERQSQMLPLDILEPYLSRMRSMPSGGRPSDADRLPY